MPADVGYDKKRSENHDIYWRESQRSGCSALDAVQKRPILSGATNTSSAVQYIV